MIQPLQHLRNAEHFAAVRARGPFHHEDRQAQDARRVEFGVGAPSSRVLGHDDVHPMPAHERQIAAHIEGTARNDHRVLGQWRRLGWRIDQSQDVVMLRLRREFAGMQPADSQQDAFRRPGQGRDGAIDIGHRLPAIAGACLPGGSRQRQQGNTGLLRGGLRMPAHLRGERMRCIDEMGDRVLAQIANEPRDAAEAADPYRDRLRLGLTHAPGIGQNGCLPAFGEAAGQSAGFGRSAQDKDVAHA